MVYRGGVFMVSAPNRGSEVVEIRTYQYPAQRMGNKMDWPITIFDATLNGYRDYGRREFADGHFR